MRGVSLDIWQSETRARVSNEGGREVTEVEGMRGVSLTAHAYINPRFKQ